MKLGASRLSAHLTTAVKYQQILGVLQTLAFTSFSNDKYLVTSNTADAKTYLHYVGSMSNTYPGFALNRTRLY